MVTVGALKEPEAVWHSGEWDVSQSFGAWQTMHPQREEPRAMAMTVGVVSDTHGLVRPEMIEALRGVDLVIHAGDVGDPSVLDAIRDVAPVHAVRGNIDRGAWAEALPLTDVVEVEETLLYVIHDVKELDLDPTTAGFHVVIFGHTHQPLRDVRNGVLFLNPGSAGPRRFSLPIAMALLHVSGTDLEVVDVSLDERTR